MTLYDDRLKIAWLLREASLPQTVTRVDAGSVRVMFAFPDRREGVNELLTAISQHPGIIAKTRAAPLGISIRTATRRLGKLRAVGSIEFRGAPKTGGFHVLSRASLSFERGCSFPENTSLSAVWESILLSGFL
ncbi:transcriptional regulator [Chlorobium phaeovibrioides]|uniref:Transcriptional regulator n=3 Tax=Chlorobium phaeovibrioides TaxID=1094 RepID=A0A3S0NAK7_CHLPH|nr:transcriptional regulator [Chlorobium phaeovibrioides]RTY38359.1 transcriptional regulator [Chlorobium phaeovibrioides]